MNRWLSLQQLIDHPGCFTPCDRLRIPLEFCLFLTYQIVQKCNLFRCGRLGLLYFICKLYRLENFGILFLKIVSQCLIKFGSRKCIMVMPGGLTYFQYYNIAQAAETFGIQFF